MAIVLVGTFLANLCLFKFSLNKYDIFPVITYPNCCKRI